jgi:hypothetical protein
MFALMNIRSYRSIKGLSNKEKTSIGLFYNAWGFYLEGV